MNNTVGVTVSGRHVHLSEKDAKILFGANVSLTPAPGNEGRPQYPAVERVEIRGPKRAFCHVAIMLPLYKDFTQIEVSLTDARALGLQVPIRNSKEIAESPGVTIIGPAGEVVLTQGVIAAKRHIHVSEAWAAERGLQNNQIVKLAIRSQDRSLVFDDVVLRAAGAGRSICHIDIDEANAAGVSGMCEGTVIF